MKILYVSTISDTVNAFLVSHIKMLLSQGYSVDIACNHENEITDDLICSECRIYDIKFQRSPFNSENITAFRRLKEVIEKEKYNIVHTHTPVASALVRMVCRRNKHIKVLYTAHGFHFYKGAPLLNWILYYPAEKFLSKYTDILITINREDYLRAKKLKARKVLYMPGVGIDTCKFSFDINKRKDVRKELGIADDVFVILSVGELCKNKNHRILIKALQKLKNRNYICLVCGSGRLKDYLEKTAEKAEVNIRFLGHVKNISRIYSASDLFVFPSFREGLPVSLMEAMAAGLFVVCSDIRGNRDLIEDKNKGFLINPDNWEGFLYKIEETMANYGLYKKMGEKNSKTIKKYDITIVNSMLLDIYKDIFIKGNENDK